jgi:hypothetical protein
MGNQLYLNKFQPTFILLGFVLLCSLEWCFMLYLSKKIVSCYFTCIGLITMCMCMDSGTMWVCKVYKHAFYSSGLLFLFRSLLKHCYIIILIVTHFL